MKTNTATKAPAIKTHEGAPAKQISAYAQLRRSVLACFLWEDTFYESGQDIAARILDLTAKVEPAKVADLAVEARSVFNLRHAPLMLLCGLIKHGKGEMVARAITNTIQRADELAELLAIYWKVNGKDAPLSAQLKKGLAAAFGKFNEYALAKYNRDGDVKLRDVLFLSHAKPKDAEQDALWKRLIAGELATPDTWEVSLSGGADKKETFERLIREEKLGYLALLRNLRNIAQTGADADLVNAAILARKGGAERVLPFRFVAAARAAPQFEPALDKALVARINETPPLSGKTIVLVDTSGSMRSPLSSKSDLHRATAAATLASVISGDVRVFAFADRIAEVPARRGMAGVDAVLKAGVGGGTMIGMAVKHVNALPHDRLIVVTDEQSWDAVPKPVAKHAYMINVAAYQNGVGYGDGWVNISGFSEGVLRYIAESEKEDD